MAKMAAAVLTVFSVLALSGAGYIMEEYGMVRRTVYTDENHAEIPYNPLIGYAPPADYIEAVGDNTLVYIEALWSELEPREGGYDFAPLYEENHIEQYKSEGKKAVFRLVCDKPGDEAHMDIPGWLYDRTGDGSFYDTSYGKGYAPDYANEVFIEAHDRLLQAVAYEFAGDNFLAYIEIGSIGHWGEWHVKADEGIVRIPAEETCMRYVAQYVEAFPDTCLLMRRPFLGVREYGLGVYNDMTGDPEATGEWLDWLENGGAYTEPENVHTLYPVPDFYKKAPVGGEFTSGLDWGEMLADGFDRTKALTEASHMSFIGPKCPHGFEAADFPSQADALRGCLGYKLGIGRAVVKFHGLSKTWDFEIALNNKGIAPIAYDWDCCLYFYDREGEFVQKLRLPVLLSDIMPGETLTVKTGTRLEGQEISRVAAVIEDPMTGAPAVHWNNINALCLGGCGVVLYDSGNGKEALPRNWK